MKKIVLLVIVLFTVFLVNSSYAMNKNFEIQKYHIEMRVRDDNSYEVTETIDVQFNIDRHGIIRNIPLKASNGDNVKITDVEVNNKFATFVEDAELNIKIGDSEKYANRKERYVIKYLYQRGIDGINDMDELYFNLIGVGWDVEIRDITFDITMPLSFNEGLLNFTYGIKGSTETVLVNYTVDGNRITGRLDKALKPNEALTIALPLPEGYYVNATALKFGLFEVVNSFYLFIHVALLLLAGLIYLAFGKSRRIYPPIEFYPPHALTPADLGYIFDGRADPQDVTALIIYWANKGLLQIIESPHPNKRNKTQIALYKFKDIDDVAKEYEINMFNTLFDAYGDGSIVYLESARKTFHNTITCVQEALMDIWYKNKGTRIYSAQTNIIRFVIRICSLIAGAFMFLGISSIVDSGDIVGEMLVALLISTIWHVPIWRFTSLMANWKGILPKLRLKASFKKILMLLISISFIGVYSYINGAILKGVFGFLNCYIISFIAAKCLIRTKTGDLFMEKILGFRDFVLYAERDRINTLVDENPAYFFDVLPYAIIFGITDKWAEKFEGITMMQPSWYQKPAGDSTYYDSYMYTNVLAQCNSTIASYAGAGKGSHAVEAGSSSGGSAGGGKCIY